MTKYTVTAYGGKLEIRKNGRFFTSLERRFRWYPYNKITGLRCDKYFQANTWAAEEFERSLSEGMTRALERFNDRCERGDMFTLCTK